MVEAGLRGLLRKKFILFYFILNLLLTMGITKIFSQISLPEGLSFTPQGGYANIFRFNPPNIERVEQTPLMPTSQEEVNISGVIFNDPHLTDDITIEVKLYFTINKGNTWEEIEMEQDEEDEKIWRATIPAQEEGSEVIYYIWAKDTAGNIATEYPRMQIEWPLKDTTGLVKIVEDPNDKDTVVANDLDIISAWIGYDEEYLYLKWQVEGEFSAGTISPPYAHIYGIGLVNFDDEAQELLEKLKKGLSPQKLWESLSEKEKERNMRKLFGLYYGEHIKVANYPSIALVHLEKSLPVLDTESFEHEINKSYFSIRIKRSALGESPARMMKLLFGTGVVTNIYPPNGALMDASNFVNFYLRYHSYMVK